MRRKWPLVANNEGEADNPGPRYLKIASANVTSLRRRWPIAKGWACDVLCVQETMLGEQAQREMEGVLAGDGWTSAWGHPRPLKKKVRAGSKEGQNPYDAQHGGVGVLVRSDHIISKVPHDPMFDYLFDDGHLVHCYVPTEKGGRASMSSVCTDTHRRFRWKKDGALIVNSTKGP